MHRSKTVLFVSLSLRGSLIVATIQKIYVFDLGTLKKQQEYSTYENEYGLVAINSKVIVIPDKDRGALRILVLSSLLVLTIRAVIPVCFTWKLTIIRFETSVCRIAVLFWRLFPKKEHSSVCTMQAMASESKCFDEESTRLRSLTFSYRKMRII